MSEVTGNIRTCPKRFSIFLCKWCEYDSRCGEQLKKMTDTEREAHFEEIFNPFPSSNKTGEKDE